ncbi:hypothetical protein DBR32_02985 [Taibaiella sp. KBW10]|uniref:hypothetical protein n=1 Tax=Taibaiella sp. KBW10 TaxID=2153357 RepID=UPI000F5A6078|nr:hypothetical protein [Taibaiella sp. KBW10]RQO32577.1 hypothetical protein DBR32_02985 [Taibaiella sp. KBW10]
MKKILIILAGTGAFMGQATAQQNPLKKTAWKINSIDADGHALLEKVKWIDLKKEQAKFHYIEFDTDDKYHKGTSCFGEDGRYELKEEQQISLSGMDAVMAVDCTEPQSLNGTFTYTISGNRMTLQPVSEGQGTAEEAYPEGATDAAAAVDIAAATAEAAAAAISTETVPVVIERADPNGEVQPPSEYAAPEQPYRQVRTWISQHFDAAFFKKQGIDSDIRLSLSLQFDAKGKATLKEVQGTTNAKLKQAIRNKIGTMPQWSAQEVSYNSTVVIPLQYLDIE